MRGLAFGLVCWAMVPAAQAAIFGDDVARKQITDVQKQVQTQSQTLQSLDQRVTSIEATVKGRGLMDILSQLEQMRQELRDAKGQLEVLSHEVEVTQQRQNDLYVDLDSRLRKLEAAGVAAAAPQVTADTASTAVTAPEATAGPTTASSEARDLDAAQAFSKAGKYKEAFEAFNKFLTTYPASPKLAEAQYGLGFAQFSLKNYKAAIATQQKLIKQFPESPKAPDAAFNIANAQIQLADIDGARKTLRDLLAKYPNSDIAPTAKRRLAILESVKTP
jgi:tol-pal system protein YbgF